VREALGREIGAAGTVARGAFQRTVAAALVFILFFWDARYVWSHATRASPWLQPPIGIVLTALTALLCRRFFLLVWRNQSVADAPTGGINRRAFDILTVSLFACFLFWAFITTPFAYGTYWLDRERLTVAACQSGEVPRKAYYKALDEYVWSTLDVVPFIDAPRVLDWTEPADTWPKPGIRCPLGRPQSADTSGLKGTAATVSELGARRYSWWTGVLLVIYRAAVLAPLLAALAFSWRAVRHRQGATPA
jgi:hypothetical protein